MPEQQEVIMVAADETPREIIPAAECPPPIPDSKPGL